MVGMTATPENSSTSRMCSREPAEPRRRSTQTRVSRPASTAPSSSATTMFASTMPNTRFGRGTPCASSVKVAMPSASAPAASSSVSTLSSRISTIRPTRERGAGAGGSGAAGS